MNLAIKSTAKKGTISKDLLNVLQLMHSEFKRYYFKKHRII